MDELARMRVSLCSSEGIRRARFPQGKIVAASKHELRPAAQPFLARWVTQDWETIVSNMTCNFHEIETLGKKTKNAPNHRFGAFPVTVETLLKSLG